MSRFRTTPPYIAKAQALAALAAARPHGITITFASKAEAMRERMRFYQARKDFLRSVPDDTSPLSTVETKIIETPDGAMLRIHRAGQYLFEGLIRDAETGEAIDASSVREAAVAVPLSTTTRELEVLEALWEEPKWAAATASEREAEVARRLRDD